MTTREEELNDYKRMIEEKSTIADYILSKLIKLRQQDIEENIIKFLEDEFDSFRLEILKLEKFYNFLQNCIKN